MFLLIQDLKAFAKLKDKPLHSNMFLLIRR